MDRRSGPGEGRGGASWRGWLEPAGQSGGRKMSRPGGWSGGKATWKQGLQMLTGQNVAEDAEEVAKARKNIIQLNRQFLFQFPSRNFLLK